MKIEVLNLIMLVISAIVAIVLFFYIRKNNTKNALSKIFQTNLVLILIWIIPLIFQILLADRLGISPIVFDYVAYIGICLLPVGIFFTGLVFAKTKIKIKRYHLLLLILPVLSILMVWTNDLHHLFYVNYSLNLKENVYGPFSNIYTINNTILYLGGLFYLLKYSIKNSGFFSKQAILFIFAFLIPYGINALGSMGIVNMSVYVTPMLFTATLLLCAIAIFKFDFLRATPIAMQRIVDRMSDSFIVISEQGAITDFNDTFLRTFHLKSENVRNKEFIQFLNESKSKEINQDFIKSVLEKCKKTEETILVKREMQIKDRYFNIEASGIFSKNSFLGTLVLLKDVTQHMQDMQTIQNNQNMLMERERLASLGQLIGGIAHNLKTPIMSIAGATQGLTDLVQEYETSLGDPDVTIEDYHDIAKDMTEWITKIKSYTEYMSDVITAVKGQAVTMSEEQEITFTLDELVKRVNILMRHELKNALVVLNIEMKAKSDTIIKGNPNSLVQVINNMISNAIQVYNGKQNQEINLILEEKNGNIIISVQDFGDGLPEEVQEKLFKEMITTKGKNGTGLGLFMSYSTIRAHFNGNITFDTKKGKGTTFHITLPI